MVRPVGKVTYLYHSGFAVELESKVLIFDYYDPLRDGEDNYEGRLNEPVIPENKQLIMFFSHKHQDHFQISALKWAEKISSEALYFLGNDIKLNERYLERKGVSPAVLRRMTRMAGGAVFVNPEESLKVETLKSTDRGVAFMVTAEGVTIYHAGDLNWWYWEEESEAWNKKMEKDYKKEIDRIAGRHFDLAFVPLDPRLGKGFCYGMDYFLQKADADKVFPMHMWEEYDVAERYRQTETGRLFRNKIMDVSDKNREFFIS